MLVFRDLAIIGPDSAGMARVAAAAALNGRLWQFTELAYRNQGLENSGYATDGYLRRLARAAGVDPAQALAERTNAAVDVQLAAAKREADRYGVRSTPSFLLRSGHAHSIRLSPRALTVAEFAGPIDAALRRR
jgi:protein-disulfide isomerase